MNTRNYAPVGLGCATLIGCSPSAGPWWRAHCCSTSKPSPQRRTRYLHTSTIAIHLFLPCCFIQQLSAMRGEGIFARFALYGWSCAASTAAPSTGMGSTNTLSGITATCPYRREEMRELLDLYEDFHRLPPAEVVQPAPYGLPIDALGPAHDAFLCRCSSSSSSSRGSSNDGDSDSAVCDFISTSRAKMRQHINQQHSVKLTRWSFHATASHEEHAAQL
jgi:hypothetical protein